MFTTISKIEPRITYTKDIGFGEQAHKATLTEMAFLINSSLKDWGVRETAVDLVAKVPERDRMGEAKAIFKWVQNKLRYTYDPRGLETVQTPRVMLEDIASKGYAGGDCDDFSVLIGALLRSIGHEIRLKAVAFLPSTNLSHVYLEDKIDGVWITLDGIKKNKEMGWESERVGKNITLGV